MVSFNQFLNLSEAVMTGSGATGERHAKKYIDTYKGKKHTHTLAKTHEHIQAGEKLTIHGRETDETGKIFAIVSSEKSPDKKIKVPISKIDKPVAGKNKGFDFETSVVEKLNKHNLMKGGGAGFTGGNDFHLIDKKKNKKYDGKMAETIYQGETKKDLSAAFGQMSLHYTPEKGWHVADKTREKHPEFAKEVEKAVITVNGKKKKLLDHINDTFGEIKKGEEKSKTNVYSDDTDLSPMHGYLKDHDVDILHVGSHGTFRAGHSHGKDRTGLDLSQTKGSGKFRVRQKHDNALTVQFNVKSLNKSAVNIENEEHLKKIKEKLGHED